MQTILCFNIFCSASLKEFVSRDIEEKRLWLTCPRVTIATKLLSFVRKHLQYLFPICQYLAMTNKAIDVAVTLISLVRKRGEQDFPKVL